MIIQPEEVFFGALENFGFSQKSVLGGGTEKYQIS